MFEPGLTHFLIKLNSFVHGALVARSPLVDFVHISVCQWLSIVFLVFESHIYSLNLNFSFTAAVLIKSESKDKYILS